MPHRSVITRARAEELLSCFARCRMMVVGDLMLDRYVRGKAERISPEAPVPVVRVESEDFSPGGAANVAKNLRALGAEVTAVGVVGDDREGDMLLELLREEGVDLVGVVVDPGRPTTVKTRVIAHHQHVVRVDREVTDPLRGDLEGKLRERISGSLEGVDGVVVSDYAKGTVTQGLLDALTDGAAPVVVDPKEPNFGLYRKVRCVTPNRLEAERASGVKIGDLDDLERAGRALLERWEADMVLITRGEEGMSLFERDRVTHIPTVAREVYDVSGAGDTVVATFTLALAAGAEPKEAAYLANVAAGIVVGKLGTATASPEEILSWW